MAEENNILEVELDDRLIYCHEKHLVQLQALWRGAVVRKRFRLLKKKYNEIFEEIEDDSGLHTYWPNRTILQRPIFLKTYDYQKALEKQAVEIQQNSEEATTESRTKLDIIKQYQSNAAVLQHSESVSNFVENNSTRQNKPLTVDPSVNHSYKSEQTKSTEDPGITEYQILLSVNSGTHEHDKSENGVPTPVHENQNASSRSGQSDHLQKDTRITSAEFEELVPVRDFNFIDAAEKTYQQLDGESVSSVSDSATAAENKVPCIDLEFLQDSAKDDTELSERQVNTAEIVSHGSNSQKDTESAVSGDQRLSLHQKEHEATETKTDVFKPVLSQTSPRSSRHSSARSHKSACDTLGLPEDAQKSPSRLSLGSDRGSEVKGNYERETGDTCEDSNIEENLKGLTKEQLSEERRMVAMELLWIQQAIDSRKQYLHLRSEVGH